MLKNLFIICIFFCPASAFAKGCLVKDLDGDTIMDNGYIDAGR